MDVTADSLCSSQTDLKSGKQPAEADPGGNESTALSNTLILTNLYWQVLFSVCGVKQVAFPGRLLCLGDILRQGLAEVKLRKNEKWLMCTYI